MKQNERRDRVRAAAAERVAASEAERAVIGRVLTAAALVVATLVVGAGPAAAADGWLSECSIWHGEQHCREQYTKTHIPTKGELREKPRDCRTSWAARRNCGGEL